MSRIFINYRRQDSEGYVGRLYDHFMQHFRPEDVFMDVDDIPPGADFVQVLEAAVADCDVFLSVIGPAWLTIADENGERRLDAWDDFVRIEIASALKQDKLVIPVLVGSVSMPPPDNLPDDIQALSRRNAVELTHQRFQYDVQKLVDAIKSAVSAGRHLKAAADPQTLRQKEASLKALRQELVNATDSPLYQHRIENSFYPVLGGGNPDAALIFIGEAPGKYEAEVGRPFAGPSGDVFDEFIGNIGLRREDVYLTNVVLDRPLEKNPTSNDIAYYAPYVDRMLDIIQPAVIVTLGRVAMEIILKKYDVPEKRGKISSLHGAHIKADAAYGEVHIVPMYHPAVILYSASKKDVLREDFETLRTFV